MRTAFLIDGFNFYYAIKSLNKRLRWFDYRRYCQHFINNNDTVEKMVYFTAIADWQPETAARHRVFIAACQTNGIEVVFGKFKGKTWRCEKCGQNNQRHEEKATDVNIALTAYRLARQMETGKIILVTGDTDFVPVVKAIQRDFSSINVGVIFPPQRVSKELKAEANFYYHTGIEMLADFQLPEQIIKSNGKKITRPSYWL
ncbi:MAG: NYN domain-containing protein [Planctomycetota bacterium]|jgi:uncharacterized LabA/DUF88 family protein|nr:NYN domain-containing protein [Planctomycetota bacterium]